MTKIDYSKKPPLSYYGGKQLMKRYIIPNIPEHKSYIETFAGGAAVFFGKEKSELEILNDTNRELMNFYEVLRDDFDSLQKLISISLHSRDLHRQAWIVYNNPDMFPKLKRAWAIWVLATQGFGGMISGSWGRDKTADKTGKMIKNKRENFTEVYQQRLETVTLERTDAVKLIKSCDFESAFFYCDPPYYNADMGHYGGYTLANFEELLQALSEAKGKFLLSSYPSDILSKYKKQFGWHQFEVEQAVPISKKGKRKIEVLTANYPIKNPFN